MPKKLVSLGGLNINLVLELSNKDMEKYLLNWEKINSLKDLSFINKEKDLWSKIEIKSNDNIINFFLYMNKVNKNKIYAQFITLNEIIYNEEQKLFENFIRQVTTSNFLYILPQKIYNSIKNIINIELIYGNNKKVFQLISSPLNYNNNLKESNSHKKEEENEFIKLSYNEKVFGFFDYLLLDYKKMKQMDDLINMKIWNKFFINLKQNFQIKIISYLSNISLKEDEEKFFNLIDIFIFPYKNDLQNILIRIKQIIENKNLKKELKDKIPDNKNGNEVNKNKFCQNEINNNKIGINNSKEKKSFIYRNKSSQIKNVHKIKYLLNRPLDINNLFIYFNRYNFEEKIKFINENKILMVLEEFKDLFFYTFNKKEKYPFLNNFKFQIYPEINIHNIEEINTYKKLIKKNSELYSIIFYSCLLSVLLEEGFENEEIIVKGFLLGNNCIKKLIQFEKKYKIFPRNTDILLTQINENDIKKYNYIPQSESRFILDGNNINSKKQLYNPLMDKYSKTYFSTEASRDIIRKNGLIDNNGNLFYDKVYKDSLGINPIYKKNRNIKYDDIYSMKILKDIKSKQIEKKFDVIKDKFILNKKMIGFNQKSYQYSIYKNAMKKILPKINIYNLASEKSKTNKKYKLVK